MPPPGLSLGLNVSNPYINDNSDNLMYIIVFKVILRSTLFFRIISKPRDVFMKEMGLEASFP